MRAVVLLLKTFSWSTDGTQSDAIDDEFYSLHYRILGHLFNRLEEERVARSKARGMFVRASLLFERYRTSCRYSRLRAPRFTDTIRIEDKLKACKFGVFLDLHRRHEIERRESRE